MRSTILIFPRSNLRAVREQPRRPRRDPLFRDIMRLWVMVVVGMAVVGYLLFAGWRG